jgi:hypothetical protein
MNKQNIKHSLRRPFIALAIVGTLIVGALFTLSKAQADYGPGALYQIEFVSGDNGSSHLPVGSRGGGPQGGGVWLWIALYPDFTADYAGSDCLGGIGSFRDTGDATWQHSGTSLVISGVHVYGLEWAYQTFLGIEFHTTITVPAVYGHYTGTLGTFMTVGPAIDPNGGMSLVQVAGGEPGTTP